MRLVLHIGTEKTATTTIQEFVYKNRKALSKQGIGLSDALGKPSNRLLAQYCLPAETFDEYFSSLGITEVEAKKRLFASLEKELAEEIRGSSASCEAMFMSSEHLHSRLVDVESIRRLKNLLDPHFSEFQIVCYFREQSALVKSLQSTAVKTGNTGDFSSRIKSCVPGNHYYNYYEFFCKWRDVFGHNSLAPRLFSEQHFVEGDIRKDVLRIIDKTIDFDDFDFAAPAKNTSHGSMGIELERTNNQVNPKFNPDGSINQRRLAISKIIGNSPLAACGSLEFAEARNIYQRFNATNKQFAKAFLGQQDNPFDEPPSATGNDSGKHPVSGPQSEPIFNEYLLLLGNILQLFSHSAVNDDTAADTLRDIALKIEAGETLGLTDARALMALANAIRPQGPLIKRKLAEYDERLDASAEPGTQT